MDRVSIIAAFWLYYTHWHAGGRTARDDAGSRHVWRNIGRQVPPMLARLPLPVRRRVMDASRPADVSPACERAYLALVARYEWSMLEADGDVRIAWVPDDATSWDDVAGDLFNPAANPDIPLRTLAADAADYRAHVAEVGVWGAVAQYRCPCCGSWATVHGPDGAVWGIVGQDDDTAEWYGLRVAAVRAYLESGRGSC